MVNAGQIVWIVANLITLLGCIPTAVLWHERMIHAREGKDDAALLPYVRRQHWRNHRWCFFWFCANIFIASWAIVLDVAAITTEGDVPIFVWAGTLGFTVFWLAVEAAAFWDFWAVGTIAQMRAEHETSIGC